MDAFLKAYGPFEIEINSNDDYEDDYGDNNIDDDDGDDDDNECDDDDSDDNERVKHGDYNYLSIRLSIRVRLIVNLCPHSTPSAQ